MFAEYDYLHVGLDGELFFAGLHQRLINAYRRTPTSLWNAWIWRGLLAQRIRHAGAHGADLTVMIVPEKLTIYPHKVQGRELDGDAAPCQQVAGALKLAGWGEHVFDLVAPLRASRDRLRLYLETDSHWTHAGAHLAYQALCHRLGTMPRPYLKDGHILHEEPLCGDLGIVCKPNRIETVIVRDLAQDAVRVHANPLILRFEARATPLLVGEGVNVVYRNAAAGIDPRTLVIFGDSYCHHSPAVRSGALTRLLAETFREVHFLWNKSYDPDYVARVRPDLVLCEIAERYLYALPAARFSQTELEARLLADLPADPTP